MQVKFFVLLFLLSLNQLTLAQQASSELPPKRISKAESSFFEYIIADSIFEITLTSDFRSIRKNKYKEEYYPARLHFTGSDSTQHSFKVSLRSRGNSRKKLCYHPSLKLKIPKKELKKKGLNDDNKYKMVCQCTSGKANQQTLLREYLAYKIYNLITPNSFQVHLFQINYFENEKSKGEKRFGFLIESEDGLEDRLNGKVISRKEFTMENISWEAIIQMSLYQYLIANTDWDILSMHNVKILLDKTSQQLIPIPYDYDYSGLVSASYAIANPDYPVEAVTDRYFQVPGCTEEEILKHLELFRKQKEPILELVNNFDLFNNKSKRFISRFLKRFFKTIENPKKIAREFVKP